MKILRRIFILLLLCSCAAFFYHAYQVNRQVATRFKGQLWQVPAKVYARPLSLYSGLTLSPDNLEQELKLLGYRKVAGSSSLTAPGSYTRYRGEFSLMCRAFDFGDEQQTVRRVELSIKDHRVAWLRVKRGKDDMVRLDPVLIGQFYPSSMEDRILLDPDEIPKLLKSAIVAVEDRNFYKHHGIDFKSIARAMVVNIRQRRFTQGASTLTQQLAKNFFLSPEKTIKRKINEAFVAAAIERQFTKDQILDAYINEVYMGQDGRRAIHGFGLASQFYFDKPTKLLTPGEAALLVGLLKGPSYYNPRLHPKRSRQRRDTVLGLMKDQGLITEVQMKKAVVKPLGVIPVARHVRFPFYLDLVKRRLLKEYREEDLKTMGLRIFTPLDPLVQVAAEKGVADFMAGRDKALEAGVVVTASASNEIQALVGGKSPRSAGFNRALDAMRPVGSLVKPAIYLTALSRPDQYTLVTTVNDGPFSLENPDGTRWEPQNYERTFYGNIPLYKALVHSYNVSTVKLGMALGLDAVFETMDRLGFIPKAPLVPAMLLGSVEMSPVQVAQVYHTLASGGFFTPARAIRTVYTPEGEVLARYSLSIEQRLDPAAVFLVDKILQAVVQEGTGRGLRRWLSRDLGIAGKTGTTNGLRDSWFAGFSGNRLAVVWVGRDDNGPTGLTGATGALQIFGRTLSQISTTPLVLTPPENIEWAVVDAGTGVPVDRDAPNALAVPFILGSAPEKVLPAADPASGADRVEAPADRAGSPSGISAGADTGATGSKPLDNPPDKEEKPRYLIDWLKDMFK